MSETKKEIARLNQMLRDTGYGQGQIDAYVAQCERLDELLALLREVEWGNNGECPVCEWNGMHNRGCRLAAALKGATT